MKHDVWITKTCIPVEKYRTKKEQCATPTLLILEELQILMISTKYYSLLYTQINIVTIDLWKCII